MLVNQLDSLQTDACIICFNTIYQNDLQKVLLCGHNFHERCIKRWFQTENTCPVCRSVQTQQVREFNEQQYQQQQQQQQERQQIFQRQQFKAVSIIVFLLMLGLVISLTIIIVFRMKWYSRYLKSLSKQMSSSSGNININPQPKPNLANTATQQSQNTTTDLLKFELFSQEGVLKYNGQRFNLKGLNWFGFECASKVVHGLWKHNIDWYLDFMKSSGINTLRIPFAGDLIQQLETTYPDTSCIDYNINVELKGLKAIEVMDLLFYKAANRGMLIMLDFHRLRAADNTISELWYDDKMSEIDVIQIWIKVVKRYLPYWNVTLFDLKNEPHGSVTFGDGNIKTDWSLAASRIGNEILKINPKSLIFVEGIDRYTSDKKQIYSWSCWGGTLTWLQDGAKINLSNPKKLVYSPHVYGPGITHNPNYSKESDFDLHWGFIKTLKYDQAVCVGEWGGDVPDYDWQTMYVNYLIKKDATDQFMWDLAPDSDDTKGLLQDDWTTPVQFKLDLIKKLGPPTIINMPVSSTKTTQNQQSQTTPQQQPQQQTQQQQQQIISTQQSTNQQQQSQQQTLVNQKISMQISDEDSWQEGGQTIKKQKIQIKNISKQTLQNKEIVINVTNKQSVKQCWQMIWSDQTLILPDYQKTIEPNVVYEFGWIIISGTNSPALSLQ